MQDTWSVFGAAIEIYLSLESYKIKHRVALVLERHRSYTGYRLTRKAEFRQYGVI